MEHSLEDYINVIVGEYILLWSISALSETPIGSTRATSLLYFLVLDCKS